MAIAYADEATRVAAVASAEAKKQRDEKNQQKIEMFAFTSRDVMNITPDKDEFKIVKAWHDLGIEINKSDLLSQKVNINSLREEAKRKSKEGRYEEAQRLEDEATVLNSSYVQMKTKYDKAYHVYDIAKKCVIYRGHNSEYLLVGDVASELVKKLASL